MIDSKIQKQEIVQPFNNKSALAYIILSFFSLAISIILLVWVILKQYGLFYTSPIQLLTCIRSYYILKYSNSNILIAMWIAIALSLVTALVLTIIWISRMVAKTVTQRIKSSTALLQSLNCLSFGVFTGYCLTFFIQFNRISPSDCIAVYDWTILMTLTGLGIGGYLLSLVRFVMCICIKTGNETSIQRLQRQKQAQNYESLVNATNYSFRGDGQPTRQFDSSPIKQHSIRQYAPTKIKQYPLKKEYLISPSSIEYPVRQGLPIQYLPDPKQFAHYRQYNNKTDMNRLDKALPKYSRSPKKMKYIRENQSVKSEQWQTVAPSKIDRFFVQPQRRRQYEEQFKSRFQTHENRKPEREDFSNNIFLDNQSQSSKNQPLFVPQQPFYYQSLAAKIINKNRKDQGISRALSVKKIEPQIRQMQLFQMKQQDDLWVAPIPVKIRSEKSKAFAPQAIIRNYQRKLNKY